MLDRLLSSLSQWRQRVDAVRRNRREPAALEHRNNLVRDLTFELVPLKNLPAQYHHLPHNARVSVTCSPVKGIDETLRITKDLIGSGHRPVPHIAARMVESEDHVRRIAETCVRLDVAEIFVIAGDAAEPHGPYGDALAFIEAFIEHESGVRHIGITGYPDGHSFIDDDALHRALLDKQAVLHAAGIEGHISTQMCFDPERIVAWVRQIRAAGIDLPIHLGMPGVVERSKLVTMGARLGVGASLRYVKKNAGALARLFTPGGYDPDQLLDPLLEQLLELDVDGLHVFTFNQVAATEAWRSRSVLFE